MCYCYGPYVQGTIAVFWYCWLGLLTCKNRLPYNLYCVGGDVKHCTIQSNDGKTVVIRLMQPVWICMLPRRSSLWLLLTRLRIPVDSQINQAPVKNSGCLVFAKGMCWHKTFSPWEGAWRLQYLRNFLSWLTHPDISRCNAIACVARQSISTNWSCITLAFYPSSCTALECGAVTKREAHKIYIRDQWCLWKMLGIKWYHHVMRWTTRQPHLSAIVQARHFSMFSHIAQMPDAKKILVASPLENWKRPPGRPHTTWMKTIQQDLKSNKLSLNEAIDVAQNRPLWRLIWHYTLLVTVMRARNEWMNEWIYIQNQRLLANSCHWHFAVILTFKSPCYEITSLPFFPVDRYQLSR